MDRQKKKVRKSSMIWLGVCRIVLYVILFLTYHLSLITDVYSTIPQKINFQGRLTNAQGIPLTGSYQFVFRICDQETGGSNLWSETQTIQVTNGVYNVKIGSITPGIPTSLFETAQTRWLEIAIGPGAGETLSPRTELISHPYAYIAERSYGIIGTTITPINLVTGSYEHIRAGTSTVATQISGTVAVANGGTGATSLTGAIKGNGTSAMTAMTGTQNYAARWTDANTLGTGVIRDDGTNVGIGTMTITSTAKLQVLGGHIRTTSLPNYQQRADFYVSDTGTTVIDAFRDDFPQYTPMNINFSVLYLRVTGGQSKGIDIDSNGNVAMGSYADAGANLATTGLWIQGSAVDEYHIRVSSQNATGNIFVVSKNGDVGIGITPPTAKLHISGDVFRVDTSSTIATAGSPGNTGDIRWDANYLYICVGANTWKRTALSSW